MYAVGVETKSRARYLFVWDQVEVYFSGFDKHK